MKNYHGIIFAYSDVPELGDLTRERTAASLPFCGRYRLIDFALSSLRNTAVTDVGVIMQRGYLSLMEPLQGRCWASRQQVSEGHSLALEIHLSQFSHDSRTALHSFSQKPEATKEI